MIRFAVGGRCEFQETTSMCGMDGIIRARRYGTVLAIGQQRRDFGPEDETGAVVAWDDGRVSFTPFWNSRFVSLAGRCLR